MGKKARKTRWRTLSIGGPQSDSESQSGEAGGGHAAQRKAAGAWRYASSHSTPTRQQRPHGGYGAPHRPYQPPYETSKSTTRSSSTASDTKITFNEDEYTRITTPRQDVLFKKGYLSRPKPYLQQAQLSSAGNSTGDGTPERQSADGAECGTDGELDAAPFAFPAGGGAGFYDQHGVYFVNGFEPYAVPPSHVLLYDQYGHVVCFPPAYPHPTGGVAPPADAHDLHPQRRLKRYSYSDSMTESTSPQNEESGGEPGDEGTADAEPSTTTTSNTTTTVGGEDDTDPRRPRRKRRRRKSKPPEPGSGSGGERSTSSLSGDEASDSDDGEGAAEEGALQEAPARYRVDAEEFVPRAFRGPPLGFVPLHPVFAGAFAPPVFLPAPPQPYFVPGHEAFCPPPAPAEPPPPTDEAHATSTTDAEKPSDGVDAVTVEPAPPAPAPASAGTIDIAKIVSKLEQAAREQKMLEEARQSAEPASEPPPPQPLEQPTETERPAEEASTTATTTVAPGTATPRPKLRVPSAATDKTELTTSAPRSAPPTPAPRYSERVKAQQTPPPPPPSAATRGKPQRPAALARQRPAPAASPAPCPRLERTRAAAPARPTPPPALATPDQWISVSGKKKRKNKQPEVVVSAATTLAAEPEPAAPVEEPVEEPPAQTTPVTVVEAAPMPQEKEVQVPAAAPAAERPPRPAKKARKRVMVTDGWLPAKEATPEPPTPEVEEPVPTPAVEPPVPAAEPAVAEPEKPDVTAAQPTVVAPAPQAKRKHKKKTNKGAAAPGAAAGAGGEEASSCERQDKAAEDGAVEAGSPSSADVSLELERMIRRGLYGNLEQRLRTHNPTDTFIADVLLPAPAAAPVRRFDLGGVVGGALGPAARRSALPSPPTIRVDSAAPAGEEPEAPPPQPPVAAAAGRFPITRAVREWMDRTRETTPEVEIFRRPNELRQLAELAAEAEDEDDAAAATATDSSDAADEEEPTTASLSVAAPAELRSREGSAGPDLLECWEPDVCLGSWEDAAAAAATTAATEEERKDVEQAEDALDVYESLYGRGADLARIRHEALLYQQQQQQPAGAPRRPLHTRGDGGLPYRAICCTLM